MEWIEDNIINENNILLMEWIENNIINGTNRR